jgi:nucleoside-diphosphate-sugar epimerase
MVSPEETPVKVLVTGGSGFLGAWVIRRMLARGLSVRVLDVSADRKVVREIVGAAADDLEWCTGDVSNAADVEAALAGCRHVAHIAGVLTPVCRADPVRGAEINLLGTLHVFNAARRAGIRRVVYVSSAGVYSDAHGLYPEPSTHYGAFKLACEGSARAYFKDAGISSVGLRPLVIYGPGREGGPSAGVSVACKAAVRGEPFDIAFTGRTGFVYVDEVAEAIELGLFSDREGAFAYGMKGEVAEVADVLAAIRQLHPAAALSCSGAPIWLSSDFDDVPLYQDFPALRKVALSEGIAQTIAHYRAHPGDTP